MGLLHVPGSLRIPCPLLSLSPGGETPSRAETWAGEGPSSDVPQGHCPKKQELPSKGPRGVPAGLRAAQGCREGIAGTASQSLPSLPARQLHGLTAGFWEVTAVYDPPHICSESRSHSFTESSFTKYSCEPTGYKAACWVLRKSPSPVDQPKMETQKSGCRVLGTDVSGRLNWPQGPCPSQGRRPRCGALGLKKGQSEQRTLILSPKPAPLKSCPILSDGNSS